MKVFFHSGTGENHPILNEVWGSLTRSGFKDICLCVVGCNQSKYISKIAEKHEVKFHPKFSYGEFFTLEHLQSYCRKNPGDNVLYCHTKGLTSPRNESIRDWRLYMSYFCIDKWQSANMDEYDTYGVDWVEKPQPHYSGNFWIARGDYIASLPDISAIKNNETVLTKRHNAEFWIGMNEGRHFSAWNSEIPVFKRHEIPYKRKEYAM